MILQKIYNYYSIKIFLFNPLNKDHKEFLLNEIYDYYKSFYTSLINKDVLSKLTDIYKEKIKKHKNILFINDIFLEKVQKLNNINYSGYNKG